MCLRVGHKTRTCPNGLLCPFTTFLKLLVPGGLPCGSQASHPQVLSYRLPLQIRQAQPLWATGLELVWRSGCVRALPLQALPLRRALLARALLAALFTFPSAPALTSGWFPHREEQSQTCSADSLAQVRYRVTCE